MLHLKCLVICSSQSKLLPRVKSALRCDYIDDYLFLSFVQVLVHEGVSFDRLFFFKCL